MGGLLFLGDNDFEIFVRYDQRIRPAGVLVRQQRRDVFGQLFLARRLERGVGLVGWFIESTEHLDRVRGGAIAEDEVATLFPPLNTTLPRRSVGGDLQGSTGKGRSRIAQMMNHINWVGFATRPERIVPLNS